jgi:hypothetical protein
MTGVAAEREQVACEPAPWLLVQAARNSSLAERIERALHANGYSALRTIQVSVRGARVVQGRVPGYYLKQMAQVVTRAVPGVRHVFNDVRVSLADEHTCEGKVVPQECKAGLRPHPVQDPRDRLIRSCS